ncbi:MAG: GNAT family N-acetyltransferase [Ornithinimicrobium sp.]
MSQGNDLEPGSAAGGWPYRLVDLTQSDAPRMRALEEQVWFEVVPGASDDEVMGAFDYSRGQGVEALTPAAPGGASTALVGLYGAFDMRLTVPGHGRLVQVPTSGLSWVGVHPDHRRRGILREMMRAHLHRVHDRGMESVAALWAADVGIYGRFGYGPASLEVTLTLSRGTDLDAPAHVASAAERITTHMMDATDDATLRMLHVAHESTAAVTLGTVARNELTTREFFRDFPTARGTKERRQVLFALIDGQPVGYATLRRTSKWDDYKNATGEMVVGELAVSEPAALFALARRLLAFDLIATVVVHSRSTDDALVWWTGGPRAASMRVTDALWLRLVDVPAAMTQRGYAASADLVLEVTDHACAWNAGRWRFTVDDRGSARCERTKDSADLSLGVEVLGSSYLGGRSIASQAVAGLVVEHRPGAVHELSRTMRADTEPLGTNGF